MDYEFTRNLVGGSYDINNVVRVDGEGNQIYLYKEILNEGSLPNAFNINCEEASCIITFLEELTSEQETTLNNIVSAHKNNT